MDYGTRNVIYHGLRKDPDYIHMFLTLTFMTFISFIIATVKSSCYTFALSNNNRGENLRKASFRKMFTS